MIWAISGREIATPGGKTSMAEMASLLVGRGRPPKTLTSVRISTSFLGIHDAVSWVPENQVDGDGLEKFLDTRNQPQPVEA